MKLIAQITAAFCSLLVFLFAASSSAGTAGDLPRVFAADTQNLVAAKSRLAAGDPALPPILHQLLSEADKDLAMKPLSVMGKDQVPPSGDKHDYMSQAPYFWRDTNSPDGSYIRRDGQRNPESEENSDAGHLGKTCHATHTLALAFYFTGDEKYAAKATELLRIWFLNTDTRMNPNLNFGQGVPGEVTGRPEGLISARGLVDVVDAIGLLAGSHAWTAADQQGMVAWVSRYFTWLTTSKIGLGEAAASNNHGTFYDVQATALALFIGQTGAAQKILRTAETRRIASQIKPDGRMPRELSRTLSFNYSVFNLEALMELAGLGEKAGVDLWHYQTTDGRSLEKAVEFMAQFADPKRVWPYQQIHAPNRSELDELLLRAVPHYPQSPLDDALKFVNGEKFADDPARLYLNLAQLPANK